MKKVKYNFPNKESYEKFMRYLTLSGCTYYPHSFQVQCNYDVVEARIAIEIFNAVIQMDAEVV